MANKDLQDENLYSFPSEFATASEKAEEAYGLAYGKAMWWEGSNFDIGIDARQDRIVELRKWAAGEQSIDHLKDSYVGAGDLSYASLNFNVAHPIPKLVNSFTNDLTSREYDVVVSAIDRLSKGEKDKELNRRLAAVKIKRVLSEMEEAGEDITEIKKRIADKIDLRNTPDEEEDVYSDMELNYKSPFEEAIEGAIDWVFDKNNIDRIKETIARDLCVVKTAGFDIFLNEYNDIVIDDIDVKNVITSYCKKSDYSDARYIGIVMEMPLSQLRALAGNKFTDEQYFQMARKWGGELGNRKWSYGSYFKDGGSTFNNYSDYKVLVLRFEFKTAEKVKYKHRESKRGGKYLDRVDDNFELKENESGEILAEQDIVIYQGWHIVNTDYIFKYRKKPNMLRPIKGGEPSTDTEFDISLISPNMLDMRNKGLVEQMIPFAEEMIILELKMQHIVSSLRPDGLAIDISAITGITGGQGARFLTYKDLQEIYDQTGNIYIKSMRADGMPQVAPNVSPITPLNSTQGLAKLEVLMGLYNSYMEKIYQVTGFNPSMDGSIPEKGSLVGISELNIKGYNNAVKHLYDAFTSLMGKMAWKAGLMLQDKIIRGENVMKYRKAFGKRYVDMIELAGDYSMTEMGMKIEYRPTIMEQQELNTALEISLKEQIIGPSTYLRVKDMAKINLAQAERFLKKAEEEYRERQMEKERAMMEENRITQIESPKAAAEADAMRLSVEFDLKSKLSQQEHNQKMEQLKLQGEMKIQSQIVGGEIDEDLIKVSQEGEADNEKKSGTSKASPSPRVGVIPADNAQNRIG